VSFMNILLFVGCTICTRSRSGIQRVTVEIAKALGGVATVEFVKWDPIDAQLRYCDAVDLTNLYSGGTAKPHRMAQRVNYRFGDTIKQPEKTWLLIPEISYLEPNGSDVFARALSQAREYGIRTAAIFYDLIPITNAAYYEYRGPHQRYVAELLRFDKIMPISATSAKALEAHYRHSLQPENVADEAWLPKIVPILLPEINSEVPLRKETSHKKEDVIVMVGTLEPRKRQIETLEAITKLQKEQLFPVEVEIHVFGSLHHAVATAFQRLLKANSRIKYFEYGEREEILSSYQRAMFSIFASNDEGYGLPIAESIALGVPCLTANFGSMAEVAEGGGCLICNVNDVGALTDAIRTLCLSPILRQQLRNEIANRSLRDWKMYCSELVAVLDRFDKELENAGCAIERAVLGSLVPGSQRETATNYRVVGSDPAPDMRTVSLEMLEAANGLRQKLKTYTLCRYLNDANHAATLAYQAINDVLSADLWGVATTEVPQRWIDEARAQGFPGLLPGEPVVDANPSALDCKLAARVKDRIVQHERCSRFASDEGLFRKALRHWRVVLPKKERALAIVISTYNRAAFVEMNVAWLISVVRSLGRDVRIIVVDNASSDDTAARLSKFLKHECFSLLVNPQNTGMLGNLRVCSTLSPARHVWMIGDDDFIVRDQLEAVLNVLEEEPGLPLCYVNFAVYHRARLTPEDTVWRLIREGHAVESNVRPSGIYPVNEVATQHDNMFTAMYLLIFRSDLFAACFNYVFDGVPFANLTQSIPTTRWLLDNYRYVDCYWHAPVSIVGNAHNSWARYRPRWHGVIMPRVFELAREAGVDPVVLNNFAKTHIKLYNEAVQIAVGAGEPIQIESGELGPAEMVFREKLIIPSIEIES
jgi:glycosyltransferase involved in cell wall biosynthesis